MKKYITVLFVALLFLGCEDVKDDFEKVCVSDCTTVSGNFVTANNVPLKNIKLEIDHQTYDNNFTFTKLTGYCCCPDVNYTISFYEFNRLFGLYHVDTVRFKDSVRVYDSSFQMSYIVEKKLWKDYLYKISKN